MKKWTISGLAILLLATWLYYKIWWPSYTGAQFIMTLNLTWNRMSTIAAELDTSSSKENSLSDLSIAKTNPEAIADPYTDQPFKLYRSHTNPTRWIIVSAGPDKFYDTTVYTTSSLTRFNTDKGWHSGGDIVFSNDYSPDFSLSGNEKEKTEHIRGGRWKYATDGLYRQ